MSSVSIKSTFVLLGMSALSLSATIPLRRSNTTSSDSETVRLMASTPQLEYDPQTTANCTWWYDNTQATNCNDLLATFETVPSPTDPETPPATTTAPSNGITLANFLAWNKGAGSNCGGLWADAYACVGVVGGSTTPTNPGNGVQTPTPIQSGMTTKCKSFHFVESGQTCAAIAPKYGVTVASLISWNPAVGSGCNGMWAETYLCVAVL
ncbi:LysM domain-containing protein [Colletotrichum aenigma]|uniref:LysM domain-containing protein n=1 Tax=Colletotrichum aenigma TaxID=1215731 RepID=UPI0018733BD1|nr:LysM domain-containing protein [Colletotrichum aenigma]KAF5520145.1 LysM domain-containing protein [Colletotrichum aenigma]